MKTILEKLTGGDFRSIGKSNEVVELVLANPKLFSSVFSGLLETDPRVRMRAADAVEKISQQRPELLQKFKRPLLERIALVEQQEVQWHVAEMIPRLKLVKSDLPKVLKIIEIYLNTSSSNIVRVMSLQALADLALQGWLKKEVVMQRIEQYANLVATPSVHSRSKKLLKQLQSRKTRT